MNMNEEFFKGFPDIISTAQLQQMLQISENTALKLIHSGKLITVQVGHAHKILKSSVLDYFLKENNISD